MRIDLDMTADEAPLVHLEDGGFIGSMPLPDAPQSNETTVLSSAGDWIYYQSADDEAVALNVKTSETLALTNSLWIVASLSSEVGEEIRTGLIARQELATVLVHLADNRLGAVEAANPKGGIVILGELPETTEEVTVNGPAIGPARLLRLEHKDGGIEVIAVDTREAGSLRRLMESLAGNPIDIDVQPEPTGPLSLF